MTLRRPYRLAVPDAVILLVTLALLLAVVVPEVSAARRRSLAGVMRGDLRRLAAAEESYFYDHRVYSADAAELAAVGFQPSADVRVAVREATVAGWSAATWHAGTPARCALFVRKAAPVGAARSPGEVACR